MTDTQASLAILVSPLEHLVRIYSMLTGHSRNRSPRDKRRFYDATLLLPCSSKPSRGRDRCLNCKRIAHKAIVGQKKPIVYTAKSGRLQIGHELMHRTNREGTTRQQRELEAESVSYAVLAHFGIHSESRFYLATYDVTAEMLTASLQTIGNAAKKIISLIENSGEQIEEGEGEQSPAPFAVPA